MSELVCTCHCGGSMFYRHLHSDSCELSRVGEEAPMSPKKELQALRDENARLREALKTYAECSDGCTCGDGWSHDPAQAALAPQAGKGGGE